MVILFLVIINLSNLSAETIILKSGKQVEGMIIEKADDYIKIDISGTPVTYDIDEIERIEDEIPTTDKGAISGSSLGKSELEKYLAEVFFFFQNKKYESAIIKLNGIKELYPNNPNIYTALGVTYYYSGSFKEAINSFNKALSLDPDNPSNYLSLWAIYDAIGDRDNAKESLLKSIDFFRRKEKFQQVLIAEALLKKINEK